MKELDLIYSLFEKKNDGNEKYLDDGSICASTSVLLKSVHELSYYVGYLYWIGLN